MDKEEIQKMVELRSYMIEYYHSLDGSGASSGTAVTLQRDVAVVLETVIKQVDNVLGKYVRFE